MKIDFSKPYRRTDGHLGAEARVRGEGKHPKTYTFSTHGMNSDQVAAKAEELDAYHTGKLAALEQLASVRGVEVGEFRIVDCTIFDQQVTLYIDVRRTGSSEPVPGFPIRTKYREFAAIPSAAEIIEIVRAALPDDIAVAEAHDAFVAKVKGKLK